MAALSYALRPLMVAYRIVAVADSRFTAATIYCSVEHFRTGQQHSVHSHTHIMTNC